MEGTAREKGAQQYPRIQAYEEHALSLGRCAAPPGAMPRTIPMHFNSRDFCPPQSAPRDAALDYARRGWPVFPCWSVEPDGGCSCRDPACRAVGKHPIEVGSTGASLDRERIERWWFSRPRANVAVRTGEGLVVVDLDLKPERDGLQSWATLEKRYDRAPHTVTSVTGSGGRHLFFRVGVEVRNYQAGERLGLGIDVRGTNGFIIAPPSRHRSGNPYRWLDGLSPDDVEIAEAPSWLVALMTEPETPTRKWSPGACSPVRPHRRDGAVPKGPAPRQIPEVIGEGSRNQTLFSLAGTLGNKGLFREEIFEMIRVVNETRCSPPLDENELMTIATSAARYVIHASDPGVVADMARGGRRFRDLSALAQLLAWRGLSAREIGNAMFILNSFRCEPELDAEELALILTDTLQRRGFDQ